MNVIKYGRYELIIYLINRLFFPNGTNNVHALMCIPGLCFPSGSGEKKNRKQKQGQPC